jgi:hypothetical protein
LSGRPRAASDDQAVSGLRSAASAARGAPPTSPPRSGDLNRCGRGWLAHVHSKLFPGRQ